MGQTPSAQYYHQLIQLRATLGEEHPDTLAAWRDYTTALMDEGDDKTAQPELRRLVAACEQTFGPEHPITRSNRADWALCLKETNLHLQALEQYLLVADYDDGYDVRFAAVGCFIRLGCFEEATYLLHAVVRGYAKTLGGRHDLTRLARGTLVFLLAGVHQKEALVEYGRLWGVDKRSMPRPLGILADTRVLLDDITANQPKYIRETFNPVATLPVRNPEFFRFAERLKHREDFYPNLLQRLDPTLKAPTDPSDVPQRRAYCAGLTRIGRIDEAVDEYVKLIDFVAGKYGTQSDLFRSIVLELDWYQLHKSDRHALAMEHVNELRQLSKEQIAAGNNQLGQARRTGNWLKTMAQVRKQWGTCRELGTSIPKILDDWWKYIQRTVIGKKSDPAITSRHVCQCLTQWLRFYGCMGPRSRNKCYRYLDYVVRHGCIEEAAALLGPALRLFDGVMDKPDELLLCWSRYLRQLRNQGGLDLAEWEYYAFFEEYVESGINVDGIPYTGYCYCDDHDLEVLLVNIHDGYMKVLCDLGKREKAYDELQRMWNYTDDTWDQRSYCAEAFLARVVYARYLILLGHPAEARRQIIPLIADYEVFYLNDLTTRWFRRWAEGEYHAPSKKPDGYKLFARGYGQLIDVMADEWGNDDFIVMCARYNYACYLQDIGLKDSVALGQLRDAAWASEKLCGVDAPLTLQIQRRHAEMLVLAGRKRQGLVLAAELATTCEHRWGLRHPMTALQWASYVCCLHWAGEYQQVVAEAPWVIALCAYEFGCVHLIMMKLFHAAAVAHDSAGHYEKACEYWKILRDSITSPYDTSWLRSWVENRHAECEQRWHGEEGSA